MDENLKTTPLYDVLFDPQTSGGLLICVDEKYTSSLVSDLKDYGCLSYSVIGKTIEKTYKNIILE